MSRYIEMVHETIRDHYAGNNQSVAHRMDHIGRVLGYALKIADRFPGADRELLTLAILLHDVTSPFDRKEQHVGLSINTARRILTGIGYPQERADLVISIMAEHSTENPKEGALSSVEARILFDADKLDGTGATGIARAFALKGQQGRDLLSAAAWYRKKIRTAVSHMQTEPGREMMAERVRYAEEFLDRIEQESRDVPRDW